MRLVEQAVNNLIDYTGIGILEAAGYIIYFALFVWLYKEFKNQYHKDKEIRAEKIEKALTILSKILAIGYQYKKDHSKSEDFFIMVYESYPFIDMNLYKDFKKVINNSEIDEPRKINDIQMFIEKEVDNLTYENKYSFKARDLTASLDHFLLKIKDIAFPVVASVSTLILLSVLLLIMLLEKNVLFMVVRIISIIIPLILIPFFIDMFIDKKLKKISLVLIPILILMIFFNILFINIYFSLALLTLVTSSIIFVVKKGI